MNPLPAKPLSPAVQTAFSEALAHVTTLPSHLFCPQDWAQLALAEAAEQLGTPEGAEKLAEAKRYLACNELIHRLVARISELEAGTNASLPV